VKANAEPCQTSAPSNANIKKEQKSRREKPSTADVVIDIAYHRSGIFAGMTVRSAAATMPAFQSKISFVM